MTELKIMNMWQALFYMKHGVNPVRVELGRGDKMVFVFYKEDTFELFGKWLDECAARREQKQLNKENNCF